MDRIQNLKNQIYSLVCTLFCCTALLTLDVSAQVVINEVMARPADESEWVELYNRFARRGSSIRMDAIRFANNRAI